MASCQSCSYQRHCIKCRTGSTKARPNISLLRIGRVVDEIIKQFAVFGQLHQHQMWLPRFKVSDALFSGGTLTGPDIALQSIQYWDVPSRLVDTRLPAEDFVAAAPAVRECGITVLKRMLCPRLTHLGRAFILSLQELDCHLLRTSIFRQLTLSEIMTKGELGT